jgi:hypothetical protein
MSWTKIATVVVVYTLFVALAPREVPSEQSPGPVLPVVASLGPVGLGPPPEEALDRVPEAPLPGVALGETAQVEEPTVIAAALPTPAAVQPLPPPGPQDYVLDVLADQMHAAEDARGLPRGVLASIALHESGGGVQRCADLVNLFGYASCNITFGSFEEAINASADLFASLPGDTMRRLCTWVAGGSGPSPCSYGERVIADMPRFQ